MGCADAGVRPEAKGQIVVAAGLEQGERTPKMIPRLVIRAGEPACNPGGAMGDAGLGQIRACLEVTEEVTPRAPASPAIRPSGSCQPITRR